MDSPTPTLLDTPPLVPKSIRTDKPLPALPPLPAPPTRRDPPPPPPPTRDPPQPTRLIAATPDVPLPPCHSDEDDYLRAITVTPSEPNPRVSYFSQPIAAPDHDEDISCLSVPTSPVGPNSRGTSIPRGYSFRRIAASIKLPKRRRKKKKLEDHNPVVPGDMSYGVEDVPPWYLCIILGFQHYLIMFGATVANPLALASAMCIGDSDEDNVTKSQLICTIFFVSGIVTLLQTTCGVRLPIVQGGTFTFVAPIIAILSMKQWECPAVTNGTFSGNVTNLTETGIEGDPIWMPRMREIQGAIMVASLFQVVVGFTGVMGLLLRYIGPLAVTPTISLAGLALYEVASKFAEKQWWITLVTVLLIVAFSQYTQHIKIPCFHFKSGQGCERINFPIFRLFPVILAVCLTWAVCAILTVCGVFDPTDPDQPGSSASTNTRLDVLTNAPWFRVPYPGQWGTPTVSTAAVFGMLSGVLASMVESVGDYYACARMAGALPPPMHAVNRGIGVEGIGCLLAGAWGHGTGTTSYSENIGAIGITKVASRRVVQVGALIMLVFGVFGKFGALFVTIPDPIVGGVFIVMFGMVTAVGLSNLQFVDLNSSRNLFILGFSFFFGLTLPSYLHKTKDAIQTGNSAVDQIFTVLLSTSMFVGGLTGFVLDNTIPGTDDERGIKKWRELLLKGKSYRNTRTPGGGEDDSRPPSVQNLEYEMRHTYDIPVITRCIGDAEWARYLPFLPTFDESLLKCGRKKKRKTQSQHGPPPDVTIEEPGLPPTLPRRTSASVSSVHQL